MSPPGTPARALAECEAKRQIVDAFGAYADDEPSDYDEYDYPLDQLVGEARRIVRVTAQLYADREGYREEWRP